jgi:Family of unknown function (DUF5343)
VKSTGRSDRAYFPDARLKGMREFFSLLQTQPDWRPDPLTVGALKTLKMASSKESGLIRALKFLGVLDGQGHPTEKFDLLRADFQATLASQVSQSYAGLIAALPAESMTQATLVSFFMQSGYCEDTAEYQGLLFVGLCKAAGISLPNVGESFARSRFKKASEAGDANGEVRLLLPEVAPDAPQISSDVPDAASDAPQASSDMPEAAPDVPQV